MKRFALVFTIVCLFAPRAYAQTNIDMSALPAGRVAKLQAGLDSCDFIWELVGPAQITLHEPEDLQDWGYEPDGWHSAAFSDGQVWLLKDKEMWRQVYDGHRWIEPIVIHELWHVYLWRIDQTTGDEIAHALGYDSWPIDHHVVIEYLFAAFCDLGMKYNDHEHIDWNLVPPVRSAIEGSY